MITELLKMIEEVDPLDTEKLDEIDVRVWCCLTSPPASLENFMEWRKKDKETTISDILYNSPERKYTRSRDALKAIRPDGWQVSITGPYRNENGSYAMLNIWEIGEEIQIDTPTLPTEELAELHAILQAINYERELLNKLNS